MCQSPTFGPPEPGEWLSMGQLEFDDDSVLVVTMAAAGGGLALHRYGQTQGMLQRGRVACAMSVET